MSAVSVYEQLQSDMSKVCMNSYNPICLQSMWMNSYNLTCLQSVWMNSYNSYNLKCLACEPTVITPSCYESKECNHLKNVHDPSINMYKYR